MCIYFADISSEVRAETIVSLLSDVPSLGWGGGDATAAAALAEEHVIVDIITQLWTSGF